MTHFPPEEQAAYEAELRAQFEANDYEEIAFTVANDEYTAVLNDSGTTIYDDMGYEVVFLYKSDIDDTEMLRCIVRAYTSGYNNGVVDGRNQRTAEIRKALGVQHG